MITKFFVVCISECPHGVYSNDCDDPREFHKSFCTEKSLRREFYYAEELLHTNAFNYTEKPFTPKSFYTEKLLHSETCPQRSFYTEKLLHREVFCTEELLEQRPLRTGVFTEKSFYHTQASSRSFVGVL